MSRKKRTNFNDSLVNNVMSRQYYIDRLTELSISMFEWSGLPRTVDERYIEMTLLTDGSVVYFNDDVIGNLCLSCIQSGNFDVYGYPVSRRAYSRYNNYQMKLGNENSVVIYNNLLRTNSTLVIEYFASMLWDLDCTIKVNARAQKTPVLILASEKQRLTLLNLYKEFDGNSPVIFGDSNLDINGLKSINTGATYVCDKLYELKTQIWNEALTYLGINNVSYQKKERLIPDEVLRSLGGTVASRYSRLQARKTGVKKINEMFGTNISVDYRDTFESASNEVIEGGEDLDE